MFQSCLQMHNSLDCLQMNTYFSAKCSLRSNTEGNTGSAELVKKRRAC